MHQSIQAETPEMIDKSSLYTSTFYVSAPMLDMIHRNPNGDPVTAPSRCFEKHRLHRSTSLQTDWKGGDVLPLTKTGL